MLYDLIYMWNLKNNSQKTPHRMREQIGCQGHRVGGGRRGVKGVKRYKLIAISSVDINIAL